MKNMYSKVKNRPVFILARSRWKSFILISGLSALASSAAVMIPLSVKGMVDQINNDFSFNTYALMVFLFFLAILFRNVISIIILQITVRLRFSLMRDLLEEIHEKIMLLPAQQTAKYQSGTLTAHLLYDVDTLLSGVEAMVNIAVRYPLEYLGLLGVLMYLSPVLTGIVLVAAIAVGLFTAKKSKKIGVVQLERAKAKARLFGLVNENISFFRPIRIFNNLQHRMDVFRKQHESLARHEEEFIIEQAKFSFAGDALVALFVISALLYVGAQLASGQISPGGVAAALATLVTLSSSLSKYSRSVANLKATMHAGGYIEELSSQTAFEQQVVSGTKSLKQAITKISLNDLSFSQGTRSILKGINLVLIPGRPYLLRGENGAGKSTILDLLFGLHSPDSGTILFNGCDQKKLLKGDWLGRMALVPQTIAIFSESFRYNLQFGNLNATDSDIERVARQAGVHAFLKDRQRNMDESAGDRGSALSPGEAQRISIARALLRKPDVLVMDEPTNNLDSETVATIWKIIQEYSRDHIVLVITHQPPPKSLNAYNFLLENGFLMDVTNCSPSDQVRQK